MPQSTEEMEFPCRAALRDWLSVNHARPTGLWCVTWKKAAGALYLPYAHIVQECLAWGWIDSLPRRKDDLRTMLWIAPRKPGSGWSRVNRDHVATLEAQGLMAEPGRAVIAPARADGSFTALDAVEAGEIPPDLAAALAADPGARAAWDGWPRSVTRGLLEMLHNARRPETRAARIAAIMAAAQAGERPFQWAGRRPPA